VVGELFIIVQPARVGRRGGSERRIQRKCFSTGVEESIESGSDDVSLDQSDKHNLDNPIPKPRLLRVDNSLSLCLPDVRIQFARYFQ
jgi:hypothetical protein